MKDIIACRNLINKDTIYKKVVIIGNGPSGISLSYMLAGNWPYWSTEQIQKHPDELLRARLNYYDAQKSLVEHDLYSLADGLEGRSTNPVSLLLDSLQHPCADLGMELPCMVDYMYHPEKEIDHIVLGRGPPGGSWHRMDPNLRTLSLAAWMSLPGLSFTEWEKTHPSSISPTEDPLDTSGFLSNNKNQYLPPESNEGVKILKSNSQHGTSSNRIRKIPNGGNAVRPIHNSNDSCDRCSQLNRHQSQQQKVPLTCNRCHISSKNNNKTLLENQNHVRWQQNSVAYEERNGKINIKLCPPPRRNLSLKRQLSKEVETRALISRVAEYYESYVGEMSLTKYFMNDTIVTTVLPLDSTTVGGSVSDRLRNGRWIVSGFDQNSGRKFTIVCQNLVMANGASDLANRLGVKGEGLDMPWVKYELPHLERVLEQYDDNAMSHLKPVLIVGAGLSAADAVTICRSSGIPVIHVYRNRTAGLDKMLPGNVYPEYHEVHRMMKDSNRKYELYTPLPEHTITDLTQTAYPGQKDSHRVTVQHLKTGERREIDVSFCAILIGSRPDLRFMAGLFKGRTATQNGHDARFSNNKRTTFGEKDSTLCETRPIQPLAILSIAEQFLASRLGRKLFWFKNICAKCRHLNVCDRSRYKHYQLAGFGTNEEKQSSNCGHNLSLLGKNCECTLPTAVTTSEHQISAAGLGLGEDPSKPVDCKSNPIEVDKYTNVVLRTPYKGLYAMGPLVGDNFVRFIPGGALSITSSLHKRTEND
ncbi:oxidative stress-induced growth inhibitor 2-like [Topomyia yanbarensis]|uniref:oxidative stress-induced growth inhibitor 2-like n=1 Tax=Topomyia yanbarensis TaxID=2498891 RepID=UPI00273CEDA1|nr:oxidative stress-induced growth inhibitor 2-like [Topomyia yanbarensis]XP_058837550.1 oxidative stress-induced growth inhibitor 2-like [Topomyia yanbarensis]XP_058837552.1 oxidative stress-induced growth inhibitor 2-like [Topomyia yanbarensis]XP_058837553.1 oxidative stress-induced growth inhibitor 2-like [Topomyia yanbarensis]XP_058837554.1 oxidative stress-induced growth inhibitor 2-like [Topomyia yanbarensis]XP_058837555.1 oxidative stress-induced growth inhibitor 2-like [Topomyia yanbar